MRNAERDRARIYLDHNATTPVDPAVLAAMEPYLRELFGNPSSAETVEGSVAATAVERAREQVAASIGARPNEIVFTGSCTEADNIAILGVARAHPDKRHLVTTKVEHSAVLGPARALEREGWRVTLLDVDERGVVAPEAVATAIGPDTCLVSVMGANNEVGALQPIRRIGEICAERGVLFHSDLAQRATYVAVDVERDGLHLASLSAHKAYGPKGIGALYVRSRRPRAKVAPIMYGGGQERGLRPGTVPTALAVGMGEAFEIAGRTRPTEAPRLRALCDLFRTRLRSSLDGVHLNGPEADRLPNNLSLTIAGVEPYALIRHLADRCTFSASSACGSTRVETSHVLVAMFGDGPRARGAFRVAPGRFTGEADVAAAAAWMVEAVGVLRGTAHAA
ncbi:cysteine desulfurase family protein [Methylorubrum extorquens]|uniref:cysteine desulfurase family protein n=1 Tax=Methylorubrum extorquens TaxID=408 RepID=UPI001EE5C654|nr:aminotransferase class V-fold PLP-dependent enzyme [Methylorubrum extorquens]MCG5248409.1 aminotransferase class V-fold PLP-dependent enzyme [Methylorubrum extorquens]